MKNKKLKRIFIVLSLILSHMMCASVASSYTGLLWCGKYAGCSAPASIAFVLIIPYGAGIFFCLLAAFYFHRKMKR